MGCGRLGQPADQRAVPALPQRDVVEVHERGPPLELEAVSYPGQPRPGQAGQRGPPPQADSAAQQGFGLPVSTSGRRLGDQGPEPVQARLIRRSFQHVAAGPPSQPHGRVTRAGYGRLQPGHIAVDHVTNRRWRVIRPYPVNKQLGRHDPPRLEDKDSQHRPLPGMPHIDALASAAGQAFKFTFAQAPSRTLLPSLRPVLQRSGSGLRKLGRYVMAFRKQDMARAVIPARGVSDRQPGRLIQHGHRGAGHQRAGRRHHGCRRRALRLH